MIFLVRQSLCEDYIIIIIAVLIADKTPVEPFRAIVIIIIVIVIVIVIVIIIVRFTSIIVILILKDDCANKWCFLRGS